MTSTRHTYYLDSNRYSELGSKSILITTHENTVSKFSPDDTIVFIYSDNPYRSTMVNIESLINAKSLKKLSEYYSIRNNPYLILDDDYADDAESQVAGIRFSISRYNCRALQEIILPFSEVKSFIASLLSYSNIPETSEWFHLYFDRKNEIQTQSSLDKIISMIDGWVKDFVFESTIEYKDKIGYDEETDGTIDRYLDRSFSVYEFFPITEWWDETRNSIVRYFCGECMYMSGGCNYYTIFD